MEMKDLKSDRSLLKQHPGHSDDDASSCDNACSITVPPLWMTVVDELNRDISQIRSKLNELTQDHGRHLLPGFNDEDDKEVKIQQSAAEITSLFKHCERQMKALSAENRLPGHTGAGSDDIVRKNILATAATQLQELHFQFRRQQKTYLNTLQGQKTSDSVDMGDFSAASLMRDSEALLDPRFDSDQMQLLESNERQIAERNAAVETIMTSVVELSEIFKEIHVLVIDQGTLLDRIDYNIEQASEKVGGAVKELESAEKHQKNSKMMLCIYLLLVLCGAMAVVLVIKKSMSRK